MQLTLDLTDTEAEIVVKALRNEADRDRAYRQSGRAEILGHPVDSAFSHRIGTIRYASR